MTNTYIVVNTNYKYNEEAHNDMLHNGKAAAYYSPWKDKIRRIQKGDKVFLYQSGTGIVAAGIGTGTVDTKDYKGEPDEEYFMMLDSFHRLKEPLSAGERRFKDLVLELGIEQEWYDYRGSCYRQVAIRFCERNNMPYEE